jgi:putative ABC transport system permease protein
MLSYTLRAMRVRTRRAGLTALAVLVGVAIITGTLVFTETIDSAFRHLYTGAAQGAQLVVSGRQQIAADPLAAATIPASLVGRIRRLPGVAAAQGQLSELATIVGRNGRVINPGRLPTLAISETHLPFGGLELIAGSAPRGSHEVALDVRTARAQGYRVGDFVPILTAQPVRRFRISGIVALGGSPVGGQTFAVLPLATEQVLYNAPGRVDAVDVALRPGAAPAAGMREIEPLLGPELVVRTSGGEVDAELQRVSARLRSLNGGLLAFSLVAVLVGALLVFNTFSITATQRTGELAVLRALGATRSQILGAVLLEATVLGLAGSVAGIAVGPLAALAIRALFDAGGVALPAGGLAVRAGALLIGLGTGLSAALIAATLPAFRATSAAPLDALRASAAPIRRRGARVLALGGAAALWLGGLVEVLLASGDSDQRLRASAIGGAAVLAGVIIAGPLIAGRLAWLVAWPLRLRGGIAPELAGEHAIQNPSRTAASASALTIGLALVLLVTVYASGLRAATRDAIRQSFAADVVIENHDGSSPIPSSSVRAVQGLLSLAGLSSLSTAPARLGGAGTVSTYGVDPTSWGSVYRFDWVDGSAAALQGLGVGNALVEQDTARADHLIVGSRATLTTGAGRRVPFTVSGIYRDAGLLHGIVLNGDWLDRLFANPQTQAVFVKLAPGANQAAAVAQLNQALAAFPGVVARSESQVASTLARSAGSVLALLDALLALTLLMALLGIAGALNLQVYERTRELGTLRALGMTGGQLRAMVRDESLITAVIGCLTGLVLGLVLAWAVIHALSPEGFVFAVPWLEIAGLIAAVAIAGVVASLPPGHRAARIDVLVAIAHE